MPAAARDARCRSLPTTGRCGGSSSTRTAAELARSRGHGEVTVGRLEQLPWPDGTFDLITSLDVIEHTPDDRATLAELLRVCRPGRLAAGDRPRLPGAVVRARRGQPPLPPVLALDAAHAAAGAGWTVTRMTSFNSVLLAPAAAVRLARRRLPARQRRCRRLDDPAPVAERSARAPAAAGGGLAGPRPRPPARAVVAGRDAPAAELMPIVAPAVACGAGCHAS